MKKSQQLQLFSMNTKSSHGGGIGKGKRKTQRPISIKKSMHIVLKSSVAKGQHSLLNPKHRFVIEKIIRQQAKKNLILIQSGVNMGNHFHLKVKCKSRKSFQIFLRTITGLIARTVTNAKKGNPFKQKFWDELSFSRIIKSSLEELQLKGYFKANRIQREKGYQSRESYLENFNFWIDNLKNHKRLSSS